MALEVDTKCSINMGTSLALKINKRREESIKPGRHGFVLKVRTEEHIMDFLKCFAWVKKK